MGSDDAVFARVISGGTTEYVNADLLLGGFLGGIANGALPHVEQEIPKSRRCFQELAGRNPLHQLPPRIG